MPRIHVRLNLPGFSSPEPFCLANAPPSMTGLACTVLEEIGGFSKEELESVKSNLDHVPLMFLGEMGAGKLVELMTNAELEAFLAMAESAGRQVTIEVRPRASTSATPVPTNEPGRPAAPTNELAPSANGATRGPAPTPAMCDEVEDNTKMGNGMVFQNGPPEPTLLDPAIEIQPTLSIDSPLPNAADTVTHPPGQNLHRLPELGRTGRTPNTVNVPKFRGSSDGSRPTSPPCERRLPGQARLSAIRGAQPDAVGPADRGAGIPHLHSAVVDPNRTERTGTPVHLRLYQDKDDRHRRREEARVRQMELEDDEVRNSAFKALRFRPLSPCRRAMSPGCRGRDTSPAPASRRMETPPRQRPPLPVKSASTSSLLLTRQRQPDEAHSKVAQRASAAPSESSTDVPLEAEMAATSVFTENSILSTPGTSHTGNGGDDSMFGDDLPSLHKTVQKQQKRIEFLEAMHQKALTQLRKEREELVTAQQQRFHTENKMLQLEQLFSEMQAQTFEGTVHMRLSWEDWLRRSSVIFGS